MIVSEASRMGHSGNRKAESGRRKAQLRRVTETTEAEENTEIEKAEGGKLEELSHESRASTLLRRRIDGGASLLAISVSGVRRGTPKR